MKRWAINLRVERGGFLSASGCKLMYYNSPISMPQAKKIAVQLLCKPLTPPLHINPPLHSNGWTPKVQRCDLRPCGPVLLGCGSAALCKAVHIVATPGDGQAQAAENPPHWDRVCRLFARHLGAGSWNWGNFHKTILPSARALAMSVVCPSA